MVKRTTIRSSTKGDKKLKKKSNKNFQTNANFGHIWSKKWQRQKYGRKSFLNGIDSEWSSSCTDGKSMLYKKWGFVGLFYKIQRLF